jgi:hypothetical protein
VGGSVCTRLRPHSQLVTGSFVVPETEPRVPKRRL